MYNFKFWQISLNIIILIIKVTFPTLSIVAILGLNSIILIIKLPLKLIGLKLTLRLNIIILIIKSQALIAIAVVTVVY